jgi:hypothetical protein
MIPNQRIIDLMDPKDREENLPKPIRLTSSERRAADERKAELAMHNQFSAYLNLRKAVFGYVHANPRKRSTIRRGWPDFTVFCKVMLGPRPKTAAALIEFKAVGGRISPDQLQCFGELSAAGIDVVICTTTGDAIEQLIEYFELPKEALV